MVTAAAEREGISITQYTVEAAFLRMAWELAGRRGQDNDQAAIAAALRELRDELRNERRNA